MRRVVAVSCLVLGWLCANGALWDVMQVAAWGKMFAGYSATMPLGEALRETLDPAKPCKMCKGIAKAKEAAAAAKHSLPSGNDEQGAAKVVLALDARDVPVFHNDRGKWRREPARESVVRSEPVRLRPPRAERA